MKNSATAGVVAITIALTMGAAVLVQAGREPSIAAENSAPAAEAAAPAPDAAAPAAEAGQTEPAPTPVSGEEAFNTECSACHMAYPPAALPAHSWLAITSGLAEHFGEDASLDPETTQKIADFLVANAAETTRQGPWLLSGIAADEAPLRITEMPWWRRAHSEVSPRRFTRPDVLTKSNCLGCHRGGASGEAEDD